MPTPVVINLLSSSPAPHPTRLVPSKPAPTSNLPKTAADAWYAVSSDEESLPPLKLVSKNPISTTATTKPVTSAIVVKQPSSKPASAPVKGQNDFCFLSDDFDSTVHLDESITQLDDDPFASDPPLPPAKKRRVSGSPKPARRTSEAFKRTKTTDSAIFDEITFTSSPDHIAEATLRRREKYKQRRKDDLEEVTLGDKQDATKPRNFQGTGWSFSGLEEPEESDEDLPDLASLTNVKVKPTSKTSDSQKVLDKYDADKAKQKSAREKLDKAKDKTEKAKEKAAAKEAEKEDKRLEKEKRAYEKKLATELAKVNTLKTDKKVSTPEMIVDLPSSLNSILLEQTYKMLRQHEVEYTNWESELPVVKWRRKVEAKYNEEADYWEPTKPHITKEKHIMCVITAQALVDLITGAEGQDLVAHTLKLKAKFEPCEVIYLVEGFVAWMRKNKTLLNRQYTAAVRSHAANSNEAPTTSQRKKKEPDYVNEELIEDALLRLQIHHNTFIHHTNAMVETAEWILNFTQHISSIPYKTQKAFLDTGFCMDTGQVKTGDDASNTYIRMLQEVFRVTAPIAYGIVAEHPTLRGLVKALKEQGPLALEDCRKSTNKDGAFSDKRIGPAISKKIHKVFMESDPGVWIV
ncbi:ERCC4 domain-containing protein [Rhexocercosporidium sp. MPI-PUGE-AT-0058]|nr:ERCC4 domain-containing protein [Rhexocercosporidium sp. MPI-PUGE-AT-0058]